MRGKCALESQGVCEATASAQSQSVLAGVTCRLGRLLSVQGRGCGSTAPQGSKAAVSSQLINCCLQSGKLRVLVTGMLNTGWTTLPLWDGCPCIKLVLREFFPLCFPGVAALLFSLTLTRGRSEQKENSEATSLTNCESHHKKSVWCCCHGNCFIPWLQEVLFFFIFKEVVFLWAARQKKTAAAH